MMDVRRWLAVLVALAVVGALGVIPIAALGADGDPVQWDFADGGNGHSYRLSPRPVDGLDDAIQFAAETTWLGQPGYVVSILSEGEKDFLVRTFGGETLYLIGYTDRAEEGVWRWVSGESSGFEFWASGEPNDANEGEDIAVMNWQHEVQSEPEPAGAWNDLPGFGEYAIFEYDTLSVSVDIKPGSDTNPVNLKSKGVIPVAVLGSSTFDVADIDVTTLMFLEAYPAHDLTYPATYTDHLQDVNSDGYVDLVSHYRTQETGIESFLDPMVNEVPCLIGITIFGFEFLGCDSVRLLGG
jgi:hypothetical protein